jgi:hypothetical protein
MSYTPTAIEQAVWATLQPLFPAGVTLIYANQDGPRPSTGTFATVLVTADGPVGLRTLEMSDDAGSAPDTYLLRTGQQRVMQISVQTFGPAAYAALSQVVGLYESPLTAQAAYDRGISLTACGDMTRIPATLTTEIEDRWTVTITGAYLATTAQDAAAVERVVGSLFVDDELTPASTWTVDAP